MVRGYELQFHPDVSSGVHALPGVHASQVFIRYDSHMTAVSEF